MKWSACQAGKRRQKAVLSEEFERELTREVLRTELLRVKALIATGCVMMVMLTATFVIDPAIVEPDLARDGGHGPRILSSWRASCSSRSGSTARSGETSSSIATCR